MLEVIFYQDERDRPAAFSARGHAEFATHGKDIICAAVSAILQAAQLGLSEHARAAVAARQKPGFLEVRWAETDRDASSVRAIVATARLAIEEIARRYPKHVRLRTARASHVGGDESQRVTEPANRRRGHNV